MEEAKRILMEKYPHVKEVNPGLFDDYLHHYMVMEQVSDKIAIPLDELMCFFYKGKIKQDLMEREEYVFKCQRK